jgi:hypothetical protein
LTFNSEYRKYQTWSRRRALSENSAGRPRWQKSSGAALSAPYRWQHDKSSGGTGGLILQAHHQALLDYAELHGIPLSAEDFLAPRKTR